MISIVFCFGFLTSIIYLILANIFIDKIRKVDEGITEENFSNRNSLILMKYILPIRKTARLEPGVKSLLLAIRIVFAVGMLLYATMLAIIFLN